MTGRPPGAFRTIGLLLGNTWRRSVGRQRRGRQMMLSRTAGRSAGWGVLGPIVIAVTFGFMNLAAALLVRDTVTAAQRVVAEQQGRMVVSDAFWELAAEVRRDLVPDERPRPELAVLLQSRYGVEAKALAEQHGGNPAEIERALRDAVLHDKLVATRDADLGLKSSTAYTGYPALLATGVLALWPLVLVFQGEAAELDMQRRRSPMWEWLFSHPVGLAPVFAAEMLAPIAANPLFWSAPIVPAMLYGEVYGLPRAVLAALLVGVPLTVAASCLAKALEIGIVLRLTMRARGGMAGLMGWLGFTASFLIPLGWSFSDQAVTAFAEPLRPLESLPWPALSLMLGHRGDGTFSFMAGVLVCGGASATVIAGSVLFAVRSARNGLSAPPEPQTLVPSRMLARPMRIGRDPLYRKELLWFARDRGAWVQVILVPVTVAGFQLFNLRGVAVEAGQAWNTLCGAAILFGTYFITALGPRSLASEGAALWLALTWPRGMESLLRAKARLWTMLSTAIVGMLLAYAVWQFPGNWLQIALVGVGWVLFARSMALKTVTLATVPGPSGEASPIPWTRRYAIYLGMLTFATGVQTLQWPVAVAGIVISTMTSAATWQNFRAQLPFLHDPWSARMPTPPTLMHAMIAITLLVDLGAFAGGAAQAAGGPVWGAVAWTFGYALAAAAVAFGVAWFLADRDVPPRAVWCWTPPGVTHDWLAGRGWRQWLTVLLVAVLLGAGLGLLAHGYLAILRNFDWARQILDQQEALMASVPHLREAYFVMAVLIAPLAEEYLFRGLLYRALDREWGGWHAVCGSAVFFAIYHPALSWLPVGSLGAANALMFKRSGRLAPAVLLHMVYNAVVLA